MTAEAKRILLFDDDYESMSPLKELLEYTLGYTVELTADRGVIERLRSVHYDLICCDVMIHPHSLNVDGDVVENIHFEGVNWQRTGLEFLTRLRRGQFGQNGEWATNSNTPAIVLSAVADLSDFDRQIAEWSHNTRHMEKPFDPEEFVKIIAELLQGNSS
jgi:CheY-like chemotaxis protein